MRSSATKVGERGWGLFLFYAENIPQNGGANQFRITPIMRMNVSDNSLTFWFITNNLRFYCVRLKKVSRMIGVERVHSNERGASGVEDCRNINGRKVSGKRNERMNRRERRNKETQEDELLEALEEELRFRMYSPRTMKAYLSVVRRFLISGEAPRISPLTWKLPFPYNPS